MLLPAPGAYGLYGWLVRNLERLIEEFQLHEVRVSTLTVYANYFDAPGAGGPVGRRSTTGDAAGVTGEAGREGVKRAARRAGVG